MATVNTGFFGRNESFVLLAQAERAGNAVRVPYETSTIKNAPNVLVGDDLLEESDERELYAHYGLDAVLAEGTLRFPAERLDDVELVPTVPVFLQDGIDRVHVGAVRLGPGSEGITLGRHEGRHPRHRADEPRE